MLPKFNKKDKEMLEILGKRILKARKDKGLSQENLAFEAEIERRYFGDIERGNRNPTTLMLTKIAEALDVSASELLKDIKLPK